MRIASSIFLFKLFQNIKYIFLLHKEVSLGNIANSLSKVIQPFNQSISSTALAFAAVVAIEIVQ